MKKNSKSGDRSGASVITASGNSKHVGKGEIL